MRSKLTLRCCHALSFSALRMFGASETQVLPESRVCQRKVLIRSPATHPSAEAGKEAAVTPVSPPLPGGSGTWSVTTCHVVPPSTERRSVSEPVAIQRSRGLGTQRLTRYAWGDAGVR